MKVACGQAIFIVKILGRWIDRPAFGLAFASGNSLELRHAHARDALDCLLVGHGEFNVMFELLIINSLMVRNL